MNEEQGWGIPDETRDATDYEPEWIPEPEHEPEPEPPVEEEEINN